MPITVFVRPAPGGAARALPRRECAQAAAGRRRAGRRHADRRLRRAALARRRGRRAPRPHRVGGGSGRFHAPDANDRGGRRRALDHPRPDRRPRARGAAGRCRGISPGASPPSATSTATLDCDPAPPAARSIAAAWPGPGSTPSGAMIDGLPTTYPDALGANSPRDGAQAGRPAGERGRGPDQGLHPGGSRAAQGRARRGRDLQP